MLRHKENNPERIITSDCNATVENVSVFVENISSKLASELLSRIKGALMQI